MNGVADESVCDVLRLKVSLKGLVILYFAKCTDTLTSHAHYGQQILYPRRMVEQLIKVSHIEQMLVLGLGTYSGRAMLTTLK